MKLSNGSIKTLNNTMARVSARPYGKTAQRRIRKPSSGNDVEFWTVNELGVTLENGYLLEIIDGPDEAGYCVIQKPSRDNIEQVAVVSGNTPPGARAKLILDEVCQIAIDTEFPHAVVENMRYGTKADSFYAQIAGRTFLGMSRDLRTTSTGKPFAWVIFEPLNPIGEIKYDLDRTAIYVDKQAAGLADGSSWENAFTTITEAIDAAIESSYDHLIMIQGYGPDATEDEGNAYAEDLIYPMADNLHLISSGSSADPPRAYVMGTVVLGNYCNLEGIGFQNSIEGAAVPVVADVYLGCNCLVNDCIGGNELTPANCTRMIDSEFETFRLQGASGTSLDQWYFYAEGCNGNFTAASDCVFISCVGGFTGCKGYFISCVGPFSDCEGFAISCNASGSTRGFYDAYMILVDCIASNNVNEGVYNTGGLMLHCTITGNGTDGAMVGSSCRIENCNISNNGRHGIRSSTSGLKGKIIDSVISNNALCGIWAGDPQAYDRFEYPTLINTVIEGNGSGCDGSELLGYYCNETSGEANAACRYCLECTMSE